MPCAPDRLALPAVRLFQDQAVWGVSELKKWSEDSTDKELHNKSGMKVAELKELVSFPSLEKWKKLYLLARKPKPQLHALPAVIEAALCVWVCCGRRGPCPELTVPC